MVIAMSFGWFADFGGKKNFPFDCSVVIPISLMTNAKHAGFQALQGTENRMTIQLLRDIRLP